MLLIRFCSRKESSVCVLLGGEEARYASVQQNAYISVIIGMCRPDQRLGHTPSWPQSAQMRLNLASVPPLQVFLTTRYLGIVMEYVTGGDLADMVDVWNVRNRKSHRARGPGEPIPHQCVPVQIPIACLLRAFASHIRTYVLRGKAQCSF